MQTKLQYMNTIARELDLPVFNEDFVNMCEVFKGAITPMDNTGEVQILHIFLFPFKADLHEGDVGYNSNTGEMFWGDCYGTSKVVISCPETGAFHYHTSVCEALINIQELELHRLVFNF